MPIAYASSPFDNQPSLSDELIGMEPYYAYRRKNRALWELNSIVRTLYLLDYIDLPVLRRNVQKALNRGEAYHQLRRVIVYAHGGRSRIKSRHEHEHWNECARLIGNAVIYYNAQILSESLSELERRGDAISEHPLSGCGAKG